MWFVAKQHNYFLLNYLFYNMVAGTFFCMNGSISKKVRPKFEKNSPVKGLSVDMFV